MKRAVIIGTGGLGRILAGLLAESGKYKVVAFTDPEIKSAGTTCKGVPIIGDDERIFELTAKNEIDCAFLGLGEGNLTLREKLFTRFTAAGVEFPVFVHPSALLSSHARIGAGTLVLPRVVVGVDAAVGRNVVLFTGAIVEHDCTVGDHSYLSPAVVLSGGVRVGARTFLGSASTVIPGITIGDDSIVGAGAVVVRDVPALSTVVGVPARRIHRDQD